MHQSSSFVPLEKRVQLSFNNPENKAILNTRWRNSLEILEYRPPSSSFQIEDAGAYKEFLILLLSDVFRLLELPFEAFWCTVLYDSSVLRFVDSFLKKCPRPRDDLCIPESCLKVHQNLHSATFILLVRLSRSRESDEDFISPSVFGEIVYNYFIFDIPKLMDICALYCASEIELVAELLGRVFDASSSYSTDMKETISALKQLFLRFEDELGVNNIQKFQICQEGDNNSVFEHLKDMALYINDIGASLESFLSALSHLNRHTLMNICLSSSLAESLARLHDLGVITLSKEISSNLHLTHPQRLELLRITSESSASLVNAVRIGFIELHFLRNLLDSVGAKNAGLTEDSVSSLSPDHLSQNYLELMLHLLEYKHFASALQLLYPIQEDLSLFRSIVDRNFIDEVALQYLVDGFQQLADDFPTSATKVLRSPLLDSIPSKPTERLHSLDELLSSPNTHRSEAFRLVKDVAENLDDDVIQMALEEYNNDVDLVIDHYLNGTLPDHVLRPKLRRSKGKGYDFGDPRSMDLATAAAVGAVKLTADRVWQGKRNQQHITNATGKLGIPYACAAASLAPLSKADKKRTLRLAVSIWEDEPDQDDAGLSNLTDLRIEPELSQRMAQIGLDPYEDEYDDAYQVHVGHLAKDTSESASEPEDSRSALLHKPTVLVPKSSSNEDESDTSLPSTHTVLPIENPEVVRHRRAQQQANKMAFRLGRVHLQPDWPPPQSLPPNGEFFPDSTYSSKSNNLQEPSNQRQPPASVRNGIGSRRGYPRKRKAVLSSRDDREFGNRTRTTDHDGSNVINEENSIHKPGGSGTGGGLIPVKEGESQNLLIRKGSENRGSLNGCTSGVSNSQLRGETSRQILDFSEPLNSLNVARHKGPHKSLGHRGKPRRKSAFDNHSRRFLAETKKRF